MRNVVQRRHLSLLIAVALAGCTALPSDSQSPAPAAAHYDLLIRNGLLYDGLATR